MQCKNHVIESVRETCKRVRVEERVVASVVYTSSISMWKTCKRVSCVYAPQM